MIGNYIIKNNLGYVMKRRVFYNNTIYVTKIIFKYSVNIITLVSEKNWQVKYYFSHNTDEKSCLKELRSLSRVQIILMPTKLKVEPSNIWFQSQSSKFAVFDLL